MIHILLLLLKIIGIILISVLGLLVLTVLVILFVPIRYSLSAEADEGLRVRARVSWLLHLLHAEAVYDKTFGIVIRLFGIPIKRIPSPEGKESKGKQKKKKRPRRKQMPDQMRQENDADRNKAHGTKAADAGNEEGHGSEGVDSGQETGQGSESVGSGNTSELGSVSADSESKNENPAAREAARTGEYRISADWAAQEADEDGPESGTDSAEQPDDGMETKGGKPGKLSFFQKLARFFRKIVCFFRGVRAFFSKILYTIRNICGKIEKIKGLAGYYLEVLRSEEGQRTFALIKRELGRLLRHIAPTKLKGSLTIGMDDPAATGQIIGILSMFYPIYGNNVSITPDFDEKCIRGSLDLKGRIRIITLIRIAWRVYFNKDMKKFLHMLKREENEA